MESKGEIVPSSIDFTQAEGDNTNIIWFLFFAMLESFTLRSIQTYTLQYPDASAPVLAKILCTCSQELICALSFNLFLYSCPVKTRNPRAFKIFVLITGSSTRFELSCSGVQVSEQMNKKLLLCYNRQHSSATHSG